MEHIIPKAYIKELEPLCMECPTSDFIKVKKVIEREFKRPIEEIFSYIDPIPLGSASLAQVHYAKLKNGTEVAVKVNYLYILGSA